jgi:hypothetical protein
VQIPGVTDKSNSLLRKYNSKYSAMKNWQFVFMVIDVKNYQLSVSGTEPSAFNTI